MKEEEFIAFLKVNAKDNADLRALKTKYNQCVSELNIGRFYGGSPQREQLLEELSRLKEQLEQHR